MDDAHDHSNMFHSFWKSENSYRYFYRMIESNLCYHPSSISFEHDFLRPVVEVHVFRRA